MTAEEFLKSQVGHKWNRETCRIMIEFAKYHVEKALQEAFNNGQCGMEFLDMTGEFEDIPLYEPYIVEASIIEAYPLENIK